jgi:hypothetical protein
VAGHSQGTSVDCPPPGAHIARKRSPCPAIYGSSCSHGCSDMYVLWAPSAAAAAATNRLAPPRHSCLCTQMRLDHCLPDHPHPPACCGLPKDLSSVLITIIASCLRHVLPPTLSMAPQAWLFLGRPGRLMAPTSPCSSMPMWGKEKNTYRSRPLSCSPHNTPGRSTDTHGTSSGV